MSTPHNQPTMTTSDINQDLRKDPRRLGLRHAGSQRMGCAMQEAKEWAAHAAACNETQMEVV